MLQKLSIKNIALIDNAEINFFNGLNVLSGETGAGKSVILEALNFVLGAKLDKSLIRSGENECSATAEFIDYQNFEVNNILTEYDIEIEDLLIISRKMTIDNKNSIKINGQTVTLSMLKRLTSELIDIHGQSEHLGLLKTNKQLELLDNFGDSNILTIKENSKTLLSKYKEICKEIESLGGDENQRLLKLDILNFQIKEIEDLDLKENEEENLLETKKKFLNLEKITTALTELKNAITEEGGVSDKLSISNKLLSGINSFSNDYQLLSDRLNNVITEIDDIGSEASSLFENLDIGDVDIDSLELRLDNIKTAKKKYGNDYNEIQLFLQNAKNEKDKLENFNQLAENLLIEQSKVRKSIYNEYINLSKLRKESANNLSSAIINELKELGMVNCSFNVTFNETPNIDEFNIKDNGFDDIEFMFSANLGEPVKPLNEVISGGEMSRFMLAIKSITSKLYQINTFVFDEIDTGISGNIAKIVAEKFYNISKNTQIIAISHLPQVSVMADNNILISKYSDSEKTYTIIKKLDDNEKLCEVIRLIGGDKDSETAKSHAQYLIENALKYKSNF